MSIGHCHSVEAYENGELVGGLYGVCLGRAFFGESMFHRARDASKVALVHLVARLRASGFALLDTQFVTEPPHDLRRDRGVAAPLSQAAGSSAGRRSGFRGASAADRRSAARRRSRWRTRQRGLARNRSRARHRRRGAADVYLRGSMCVETRVTRFGSHLG